MNSSIESTTLKYKATVVNGYPFEGCLYKLYATTADGNYFKVISNPSEMVHSGDVIDVVADEWTKSSN